MQSESVGTKLLVQILVCLPTKVATTLLCNINEITLCIFVCMQKLIRLYYIKILPNLNPNVLSL